MNFVVINYGINVGLFKLGLNMFSP